MQSQGQPRLNSIEAHGSKANLSNDMFDCVERHGTWHRLERPPAAARGVQESADRRFALATQHAVEGAVPVAQELVGREGDAVAPGEDEAVGQALPGRPGKIEDLGHVGKIVEGEGHRIGPPPVEPAEVVLVRLDLQVEQLDLVTGAARGRGHQLETERLQAKIDP